MLTKEQKEEVEYVRDCVLAKFPLLGITMSQLETIADDAIGTAATDGTKITYSPKYFSELSDDEKTFTYAHELLHIAFDHIGRCRGKNLNLWNIATDAVINCMLKKSGLPIKKGLVDKPEADGLSAEEMYDILLKRQQEKQNKQSNQQQPSPNNQSSPANQPSTPPEDSNDSMDTPEEQYDFSAHQAWQQIAQEEDENQSDTSSEEMQDIERNFMEDNQEERRRIVDQFMQETEDAFSNFGKNNGGNGGRNFHISSDELSDTVPEAMNWKKILQKSISEKEERWSYRRANSDNDFCARIERLRSRSQAETEVMLDISGSVSVPLLKEFLKQLKPLLKTSVLKVGYFNDTATDFTEIKKASEIETLSIPYPDGGTNLDAAVRAFSKKGKTNKIIFTDGMGIMPQEDLKDRKVIWLIYGGKRNFDPVCGKVIYVDEQEIMKNRTNQNHFLISSAMNQKE